MCVPVLLLKYVNSHGTSLNAVEMQMKHERLVDFCFVFGQSRLVHNLSMKIVGMNHVRRFYSQLQKYFRKNNIK